MNRVPEGSIGIMACRLDTRTVHADLVVNYTVILLQRVDLQRGFNSRLTNYKAI
jgi:hypothetical protein